jgi:hypothetical protein
LRFTTPVPLAFALLSSTAQLVTAVLPGLISGSNAAPAFKTNLAFCHREIADLHSCQEPQASLHQEPNKEDAKVSLALEVALENNIIKLSYWQKLIQKHCGHFQINSRHIKKF